MLQANYMVILLGLPLGVCLVLYVQKKMECVGFAKSFEKPKESILKYWNTNIDHIIGLYRFEKVILGLVGRLFNLYHIITGTNKHLKCKIPQNRYYACKPHRFRIINVILVSKILYCPALVYPFHISSISIEINRIPL